MPSLTWLTNLMTAKPDTSTLSTFVCYYRLVSGSVPSKLTIMAASNAECLTILLSSAKVSRVEQLYSVVILEDIGNGSTKEVFAYERDPENRVLSNVTPITRIPMNKRERREQKRTMRLNEKKAWFYDLLKTRETNERNVLVRNVKVILEKDRERAPK